MAGKMTNYMENRLIDFVFRGQSYNLPSDLYVALYSTTTTESGDGTEISGGGYARVAVARSLGVWAGTQGPGTTEPSNGASGRTSNNSPISFPSPTADWGVVTHFAILDAAMGGNMLYYGQMAIPKTVNAGDSAPTFLVSDLAYQIDN